MAFDLPFYLALWRMKKLPPERVPGIAIEALLQGLDSPALRQLAGLTRPISAEVEPLLERAAEELSVIPTTEAVVESHLRDQWLENAIPIARQIASEMLNGNLDLAEGWLSLPYREEDIGPLMVFFEREAPDSSVVFGEDFRARIRAAAERFLASTAKP